MRKLITLYTEEIYSLQTVTTYKIHKVMGTEEGLVDAWIEVKSDNEENILIFSNFQHVFLGPDGLEVTPEQYDHIISNKLYYGEIVDYLEGDE